MLSTEDRLVAFYREHNPEKLDSVPYILEKYKGRDYDLFKNLSRKYNFSASPTSQDIGKIKCTFNTLELALFSSKICRECW